MRGGVAPQNRPQLDRRSQLLSVAQRVDLCEHRLLQLVAEEVDLDPERVAGIRAIPGAPAPDPLRDLGG